MEKTKIIFDADMAVYDSFALSILLNNPSLEILAVTVCRGNVEVFQAAKNAVRLLREWNRLDIPVYQGQNKNFSEKETELTNEFGRDGLGEHFCNIERDKKFSFLQYIKEELAHEKIIELAAAHQTQVTLICTGPLTNLALAMKDDMDCIKCLKHIVIAAGCINVKGPAPNNSEWNVFRDPQAFKALFDSKLAFTIVPYDLSLASQLPMDWYHTLLAKNSKKCRFFHMCGLSHRVANRRRLNWPFFDELAAAIVADDKIVTECRKCVLQLDAKGEKLTVEKEDSNDCNHCVITQVDTKRLKKIIEKTLDF